ncbi:unnamed protein product [Leptidea sinapis]|uniref:Uncharacterized protein n=1 Tax=Leptidea sinapis TaxID=189913 RepID=A0A5E4QFR4_9NEOP|nr:unnamed protein product [Leptidea sinapis]
MSLYFPLSQILSMKRLTILIFCIVNGVLCRDFYVGMFKNNDILVAQDRLYKESVPFTSTYAKYGRIFKCPITYFRVVDRLGIGSGPRVEIVRGGLQKKYVVLRLTSVYNNPISVNIYVGCANKLKVKAKTTKSTVTTESSKGAKTDDNKTEKEVGTTSGFQTETTAAGGGATTDAKTDQTNADSKGTEVTTAAAVSTTV